MCIPAAYRTLPALVGHFRPADPDPQLRAHRLRVLREEHVKGWLRMRVLTTVKTGEGTAAAVSGSA